VGIWIVWLIVAAALGVAEIVTVTLAFGLVAVGALIAAAAGAAGGNLAIQFGAFAVASAAGLGIVRPIALRHIRQPPPLRTGTAALVGKTAIVLEDVNDRAGRVRIGGEDWSARSYDETVTIPIGAKVDVLQIEGATALVYPRE
jgi:membrane protein implicated in regulation of membrane protease activity